MILHKIGFAAGIAACLAAPAVVALAAPSASPWMLPYPLVAGVVLAYYTPQARAIREMVETLKDAQTRAALLRGYDLRTEHCDTFCEPKLAELRLVEPDDTLALPRVPPRPYPRRGGRHHR